jgi:RND family efflux transporter MFP subunit
MRSSPPFRRFAWTPQACGILLLAASVLSLIACDRASTARGEAATPAAILRVKTVKPARQDIFRKVVLPASVRADAEVTLYAKVTGYLKSITKDRGDRVKAGERIATLEIPEMLLEIAHARASFDIESSTFKRLEAIRKAEKSAVTDQDLDLAGAKRDMAGATLKRLETMMAYTEIRAPFDGLVTERYVDPGAFMQQGRILSMMDSSKVRVILDIPEAEVRLAPLGTEAVIRFDALPGRCVHAKVSRISGSLDPVMRTMRAELDVPNPDGSLYPGMFARAELGVDRRPHALVVPSKAIAFQHDHSFVFVDAGGTAKKLAVTLGADDGERSEICSGLNGEEAVILLEGRVLVDGAAVDSKGGM